MVMTLTPCVIYAAKSTEDKRGSIPDQLRDCRAVIERDHDRRIVGEYTDESFSAFTGNRGPGLVDAMKLVEDLARKGTEAELWAQHSDRLARGDGKSARHAVEIALWALKREVRVRTIQDPETFRDLLYAVVTGQRNHEDSRRRGLAIAAGRRRAAIRGDYRGNKPDGYQLAVELDSSGIVKKRVVMDPERKPAFEMIFRMALRGRSNGDIARALNKTGWQTKPLFPNKTPQKWTPTWVRLVLKNPYYAGLTAVNGEVVAQGHWPAYITPSQHERLAARRVKRPPPWRPPESYLLARIATCGCCGRRLYAHTNRPRLDGTVERQYVCASHDWGVRERCDSPRMSADLIEAMFVASLGRLLTDGEPQALEEHDRKRTAVNVVERKQVIDAVLAGDEQLLSAALGSLIDRRAPESALNQRRARSRRPGREIETVRKLEQWAEQEQVGRTNGTRAEVAALNRSIRSWFATVAITMDDKGVTFSAVPRTSAAEADPASRAEVHVDLGDWMRHLPQPRSLRKHGWVWTDTEIIGALQAWADANGRSPRSQEWLRSGLDQPSSKTVLTHFKTWSQALRQAGLQPADAPAHRSRALVPTRPRSG
jgi:Resolvase, N terminal domain/Recombinase/Homing endonuclease associated repeat/Recombinase zinc beta ribbon domain